MELSERYVRIFAKESFSSVYEWEDKPGTVYAPHKHKGRGSLFVADGSITFKLEGVKKEVVAPACFDVPSDVLHAAVVGPQGWIVVVAEEIVGDS